MFRHVAGDFDIQSTDANIKYLRDVLYNHGFWKVEIFDDDSVKKEKACKL